MSDVFDEETINRIKKAYLSSKNIDSVFEQLLFELKDLNQDVNRLYTLRFLREFMEQMMVYIFNEGIPKMKGPNFTKEPKKTIVLLNAIAIQKVLLQIKEQLSSLKRVGITSFPTQRLIPQQSKPVPLPLPPLPSSVPIAPIQKVITQQQRMAPYPMSVPTPNISLPHQLNPVFKNPVFPAFMNPAPVFPAFKNTSQSLSTSLNDLYKKKRATSLKTLDKEIATGTFEEHEWWKEDEDEGKAAKLERAEGEKVESVTPIVEENIDTQYAYPPNLPWKLVTLNSAERDLSEYPDSSYYILPIQMKNVVQIYLYSIDISIHGNSIRQDNNLLYYSEDDEPMKLIHLPEVCIENEDITTCQDFLDALANEMTRQSEKYRYAITLNRHTERIKISQLLESGQARNRLHLYFEQTKNNCGTLLGFGEKDLRDSSEYEGTYPHRLTKIEQKIHMIIEELSPDPLLTMKVHLGKQTKKQQFKDTCIWAGNRDQLDVDRLTIHFVDDDGIPFPMDEDHILVMKYYYVPEIATVPNTFAMIKNDDDIKDVKNVNKINDIEIKTVEPCHEILYPAETQSQVMPPMSSIDSQVSVPSGKTKRKNRLPTLDI